MTVDDWRPLAATETLHQRADIVWQIRQFFHQRGYVEVHTPTISRDTVVDRYIDPIEIPGERLECLQANAARYYLQTSPEFCMKRLLAAGMQFIYQLGPAYRAGERGQYHNPEFTMLEWYAAGQTLTEAVHFLAELCNFVLRPHRGNGLRLTEVITYQRAFETTLELDPLGCTAQELKAEVQRQGLSLGSSWDSQSRDDWLNLLFSECVQPKLGLGAPVIVTHYPASQAALAQVSESDRRTAERYELFVEGIELANGYHELLDAEELVGRSQRVLGERRLAGKPDLNVENRLHDAMRVGLPDACGCALGIDRLVMVALSIGHVDQVIAFPIERA